MYHTGKCIYTKLSGKGTKPQQKTELGFDINWKVLEVSSDILLLRFSAQMQCKSLSRSALDSFKYRNNPIQGSSMQ